MTPTHDLIVNFRDVGETLAELGAPHHIRPHTLYRGGRLNKVSTHEELLHIPTLLTLRPQKNALPFHVNTLRAPAPDSAQVYDTTCAPTRRWLTRALSLLAAPELDLPVYVHCTSGKDRTGVVIAALLAVCGVARQQILEEYLKSEGDVEARKMNQALDGLGDVEHYFRKVDTARLRARFPQLFPEITHHEYAPRIAPQTAPLRTDVS